MVIDPNDAGHIYASSQYGAHVPVAATGIAATCRRRSRRRTAAASGWSTSPSTRTTRDTVYTGNQRVYRTKNDGLSWDALTPVLDGSPISAIEVAPADSNAIYVGTENGGFFRSLDGGATWSANLAGPELPGVMITRIETHPSDAATSTSRSATSATRTCSARRDAGSTWTDIDGGKLPDVPHTRCSSGPTSRRSSTLQRRGVFMTNDGGTTWRNATGEAAERRWSSDLVFQTATKTLFAATYGRSIWSATLP